ncbi:hypothetical protein AAW00_07175 [Aurantiacibacter luteus]|uniref:Uncharacterized protein n=1 Tax=Aurantiacibacter luteus TaxID=1581420 RepID=A0A0G9MTJ0_9SPHN|nr:hypothetical protein AAW00_07175 [Aurantiacibacter luteus]
MIWFEWRDSKVAELCRNLYSRLLRLLSREFLIAALPLEMEPPSCPKGIAERYLAATAGGGFDVDPFAQDVHSSLASTLPMIQ